MTSVNVQPPMRKIKDGQSAQLSVHSVFYTIQGEGPFTGTPCVFVRLFGCNLQCPGCDTDYTSVHNKMTAEEVVYAVGSRFDTERCNRREDTPPNNLVVISGGEPLRQDISKLCDQLLELGYYVQIETNGCYYREHLPYDHARFTVVCSPKTGKVHPKLIPHVAAWKYVMHHQAVATFDGLPVRALDHAPVLGRPHKEQQGDSTIYLQPMETLDRDTDRKNLDACVASCMRYGYTLCLQTHKLIGVE